MPPVNADATGGHGTNGGQAHQTAPGTRGRLSVTDLAVAGPARRFPVLAPALSAGSGRPASQGIGSSRTWVTSSATFDRSERCSVMWAKRSFSLRASTTEAIPS